MSDYTDPIKCQNCDATTSSHKWGKVRADDWFFAKNGEAYCPLHIPAWVSSWRAKKVKR